jgi:hypothetical protein
MRRIESFQEFIVRLEALIPVFPASVKSRIKALCAGASKSGGQEQLRLAVTRFLEARHETDRKRKAELMLEANALTGLHEQIRLQETIENSILRRLPTRSPERLPRVECPKG